MGAKHPEPGRLFDHDARSRWSAYLHIAWFSIRIALGLRGTVRLAHDDRLARANFLSTFVMISQNR
jgi:hypothetical protein